MALHYAFSHPVKLPEPHITPELFVPIRRLLDRPCC